MKYLFLLVSLVCAMAISALAAILVTGQIPFADPPAEQPLTMAANVNDQRATMESLSVFPAQSTVVEDLIAELEKERAHYEQKAAALINQEQKVSAQQEIINTLKAKIVKLQTDLSESIVELEAAETGNFRRLADIYSKMAPDSAAALLIELEKERAAKILTMLSGRQAGAILDSAIAQGKGGTETAAEWSDVIRRMKNEVKPEK